MKSHHYSRHAASLRTELGGAIPRSALRDLHRKVASRHLLVAARQFAILGLATWALISITNPLIWIPLAFVQGFTVFNFTVLLHEVVHHTVFEQRRPVAERALAWLYAVPSGISSSQFTRWHLDHHAYVIPVFFIFPIAFTLNRLGQHYDIDPSDPAKWGTLMRGHWFWDFAFLNSNYHLEHHYFAGVPFYRLPRLQRELAPFYARHQIRWQTYSGLVYGWLVENRAPHTNWAAARPNADEDRDVLAAARVAPVDLAGSDLRRH
ncbi:MAG: fatty acid desaturase [Acidobacteria bacterium]|nr:fatty acid desaturase [Acidobacteriota bacterium]